MKKFVNENFKILIFGCILVITIAVVISVGISYAVGENNNTIYTRDELSEKSDQLQEQVDSINENHSKDVIWVDITDNVNTSVVAAVSEYIRYSINGKMVILDIGGLSFKSTGLGQTWLTLPSNIYPKSRVVGIIAENPYAGNPVNIAQIFVWGIGQDHLVAHVPVAGSVYWGQIIWMIN